MNRSLLNIRHKEGFGEIVAATYDEGYMDYNAILMSWATYRFLTQLEISEEPITSMSYHVLYAKKGIAYMTGDNIPHKISELPKRLPVAVKSCKINSRQLGKYLGQEYLSHIWSSSYLVPTLVELGLAERELGVGVAVNIPYHAISNGKSGGDKAFFFKY